MAVCVWPCVDRRPLNRAVGGLVCSLAGCKRRGPGGVRGLGGHFTASPIHPSFEQLGSRGRALDGPRARCAVGERKGLGCQYAG